MSADEARIALRSAVRELSERGLRLSAKWAAEQLFGLPPEAPSDREMGDGGSCSAAPMSQDEPVPALPAPAEGEEDAVLLAKSYFDVNEFRRAAHVLRGARGGCGRFLRWYALFLAGEKRQAEEAAEEKGAGTGTGGLARGRASNNQLALLDTELSAAAEAGTLDGFGFYLRGLVLREMRQPEDATAALLKAVEMYPCLWAAWTALAALHPSPEAAAALTTPAHWMAEFFHAHVALEAQVLFAEPGLFLGRVRLWGRVLNSGRVYRSGRAATVCRRGVLAWAECAPPPCRNGAKNRCPAARIGRGTPGFYL